MSNSDYAEVVAIVGWFYQTVQHRHPSISAHRFSISTDHKQLQVTGAVFKHIVREASNDDA